MKLTAERSSAVYRLDVWEEDCYLYAHVEGERNRESAAALVRAVGAACIRHNRKRVLADIRDYHGEMGVYDTFSIPVTVFPAVREFSELERIAVVDCEERSSRIELLSKIARLNGYNLRGFIDLEDAMEWVAAGARTKSDS